MEPDIDIYGIYIPTLIVLAIGALIITRIIRRLLERKKVYRYIWHPPLFNTSLYIIILSLSVMIVHRTI